MVGLVGATVVRRVALLDEGHEHESATTPLLITMAQPALETPGKQNHATECYPVREVSLVSVSVVTQSMHYC